MLTDEQTAALEAAWADARTAGALGSATINELWEHTAGFTAAVCSHFSTPAEQLALRIVDVGTGAGVPGLLLAAQLPHAHLVLIDALERRLDHVRRARRALGLEARVEVVHGRADDLGRDLAYRGRFDVAVARLLADPSESLELLVPLVRDGGVVVLSTTSRLEHAWSHLPLEGVPVDAASVTGVSERFVLLPRRGPLPPELPRRPTARQRRPLLGPSSRST